MEMRIQDNQRITANYTGTVESSRVKYGGDLQYTVKLDKPVQFRWRDTPSTRVLIDQKEVI
jgi:hypothetical protein